MTEVLVSTMEQLIETINAPPNNFIYRGQSSSNWLLESTLERVLGAKWSSANARKYEEYALERFRSKFHLYDLENIEPRSTLAWLSIMQHYGVPTRLLDFSESPYVALYFALEYYQPGSVDDLALFAIDYSALMENSIQFIRNKDSGFKETRQTIASKQDEVFEAIVDRFSYEIAWVTEPTTVNVRLDRQAGCFLLSGDKGRRIDDILNSSLYSGCQFIKYRIDKSLYASAYALLRKINMSSKTIYGDLQGLAKSIKMELQVYAF